MLYPQMNKSRAIIDLNGLWKFRILRDGAEYVSGIVLEDDYDWIAVPASYNDQKEDRAYRNYAGFVVYQRVVSNTSHPESAHKYWRSLYDMAHTLDPQNRPVTLVCCQNDYTKDVITRTMDVVCLNRYYGWYNLSGDIDAAMYALNIELDFWEEIGKPVMFTEYGADAVAGIHATIPEMFSEEYQAQFLISYGEQFDKRDFIVGEQMWNFADFGTAQGTMRADGNKKGLFTRDRKPKLSAHALRHRWGQKKTF